MANKPVDPVVLREFVSAVKDATSSKKPAKEYLSGVVTHTDIDGTVWVNVAGGVNDMPVTRSTASYSPGDVVSFSIENGVASIGGNASDPAAPISKQVTVEKRILKTEETVEKIGNVVAEKADIMELRAARADISQLQAADVTITGRLNAAETNITSLQAEDARIGNLVAGKADISDLNAATARIGTIEADYLKTVDMQAETARVDNLLAGKASVADLNAAKGRIDDLEADHVSTTDLQAVNASITSLQAEDVTINGKLTAAEGDIDTLQANTADIGTIRANSAKVKDVTAQQITAATGYISDLTAGNVSAANIISDHAAVGSLDTDYAQIDMANVNNAWISNGTIKDGAISSAMIHDLSANKLTAGTINGSVINVTNLNADNITTGTINGQRIGEGSLSLDKLSEDVYTESEVDAKLSTMQQQIDGAIETWTGTEVPTLQNAPASSWTTTQLKDQHVGDVYFVVNSQSQQNGYNYRFTKTGSAYSWQLIKDSDVTNALSRLSTAEGKITTFESDISTLQTDTGTLKAKTTSLETRMSDAESDILDKVDTTTFNSLEDTVDGHTQTLSQHTTAISNKADSSTVTALTTRVNKNETDISGINTTIGELQTTVASKADGSTVETMSSKLNTVEITVNGHTQTISSVQSTLETKADNSTVSTLRSEYNETKATVSGHETRLGATELVANGVRTDLDNLEIGGRNLLRNTKEVRTQSATKYGAWDILKPTYANAYALDLDAAEYTLSFDWESDTELPVDFYAWVGYGDIYGNGRAEGLTVGPRAGKNQTSGHYVHTFVWHDANETYPYFACRPFRTSSDDALNGIVFTIRNAKLEKGNKPTDWTPAPEDLETEVTTLKTDYATYKQTTTESLTSIGTRMTTAEGKISTAETNIASNASNIVLNASKLETVANPNISPFFSSHNTDGTYPDGGVGGYWQPTTDGAYNRTDGQVTALEDGWAHIDISGNRHHEYAPKRIDSLNPGDKVTVLVEWRNASYTGDGAFHYSRDYHTTNTQLYGGGLHWGQQLAQQMNSESGEYRGLTTVSNADGTAAWNALINFTFLCQASGSTWTGDIRISFYEGDYKGPYKPYSGNLLYASQAELKIANDSISSKVSQSDFNDLEGRVDTAESTIEQHAGQIDAKVSKNGVIAAINLSTETEGGSAAKISADKVQINGTAIFSAISSDVDSAITSKGYATTGQVSDAQTAATTAANQATDQKLTSYAPKANAVKRTQRIYYRKNASGVPAAPGTASSAWVTNGNTESSWTKYNAWSTRVPPIANTKDAAASSRYLYLYTCEQREMADGNLAYTTVLLDDSNTIIDGGNIITGTVTANKLDANSVKADIVQTTDLAASQITSGDISADRIKANVISAINSLSAGQIDAARIRADQITVGQEQVDGLDEDLTGLSNGIQQTSEDLSAQLSAELGSFVPDKERTMQVWGKLTAEEIDVDKLRGFLLQVANLILGNPSAVHIDASGTEMAFMNGLDKVAYIDAETGTFYMTKSVVLDDMYFGDGKWKWYKRSNNNMSVKWTG